MGERSSRSGVRPLLRGEAPEMGRIKVVPRSNPSFWGGAPLVFILACEEAVKLFKRIGTAIADTIGILSLIHI